LTYAPISDYYLHQLQHPLPFSCFSFSLSLAPIFIVLVPTGSLPLPILVLPTPPFMPVVGGPYGNLSLIMTFAILEKTSLMLRPVFAEVSKNARPCCSASMRPLSVSITLSGLSHLFATNTFATFELACWSICFSQF